MQNVTFQFQKYLPIQRYSSSVLFSYCQIITQRIIVQHRLKRQETPQNPMPAETVSCSWTCNPIKIVRHSVPEVELCPGALLCNAAFPSQHRFRV